MYIILKMTPNGTTFISTYEGDTADWRDNIPCREADGDEVWFALVPVAGFYSNV